MKVSNSRISNPRPQTWSPYIRLCITAINLSLGFISKKDRNTWYFESTPSGLVSPPENPTRRLSLDLYWLESRTLYSANLLSVKLPLYLSGNYIILLLLYYFPSDVLSSAWSCFGSNWSSLPKVECRALLGSFNHGLTRRELLFVLSLISNHQTFQLYVTDQSPNSFLLKGCYSLIGYTCTSSVLTEDDVYTDALYSNQLHMMLTSQLPKIHFSVQDSLMWLCYILFSEVVLSLFCFLDCFSVCLSQGNVKDYQLWVISKRENGPYPLIGQWVSERSRLVWQNNTRSCCTAWKSLRMTALSPDRVVRCFI